MQTSTWIDALLTDLRDLAAIGDERTARAADALARALGASLERRWLDLLSEVVLEINSQLPAGHVEVRLAGRDPEIVFVDEQEPSPAAPPEDTGARITLRLPESLKTSLEEAAARDGLSVNSLIVRALSRSLDRGRPARRSNRLRGFVQG
ncbi:MAG: toxin-antitoxin system HicB family antitoxin [Actinomycetota bacterium]